MRTWGAELLDDVAALIGERMLAGKTFPCFSSLLALRRAEPSQEGLYFWSRWSFLSTADWDLVTLLSSGVKDEPAGLISLLSFKEEDDIFNEINSCIASSVGIDNSYLTFNGSIYFCRSWSEKYRCFSQIASSWVLYKGMIIEPSIEAKIEKWLETCIILYIFNSDQTISFNINTGFPLWIDKFPNLTRFEVHRGANKSIAVVRERKLKCSGR